MGRYRIQDQHGLNYVTCTVVGWVDIFTRKQYRDIVLDSLAYCRREKGLQIFGYVLMSNHLHMVVQVRPEMKQGLSEILRDFKKYTATRILDAIEKGPESRKEWLLHLFKYFAKFNANNREYQFWQQDNHPIALYTPAVIWQKLDYIHANPVRNGLVDCAEDYAYSSARNYLRDNKNCRLDVDLLETLPPTGAGYVYVPMEFK